MLCLAVCSSLSLRVVGDIVTSPYLSFGITCDDPSYFKRTNDQHMKVLPHCFLHGVLTCALQHTQEIAEQSARHARELERHACLPDDDAQARSTGHIPYALPFSVCACSVTKVAAVSQCLSGAAYTVWLAIRHCCTSVPDSTAVSPRRAVDFRCFEHQRRSGGHLDCRRHCYR